MSSDRSFLEDECGIKSGSQLAMERMAIPSRQKQVAKPKPMIESPDKESSSPPKANPSMATPNINRPNAWSKQPALITPLSSAIGSPHYFTPYLSNNFGPVTPSTPLGQFTSEGSHTSTIADPRHKPPPSSLAKSAIPDTNAPVFVTPQKSTVDAGQPLSQIDFGKVKEILRLTSSPKSVTENARPLAKIAEELGAVMDEKSKIEAEKKKLDELIVLQTERIMAVTKTKLEKEDKLTKLDIKQKSLHAELCLHAGIKSSFPLLPNGSANDKPVSEGPSSSQVDAEVPVTSINGSIPSTSNANALKRPAVDVAPQQPKKMKAGPLSKIKAKAKALEQKKLEEDMAKHANRLKNPQTSRLCKQNIPPQSASVTAGLKRSRPVRPGARKITRPVKVFAGSDSDHHDVAATESTSAATAAESNDATPVDEDENFMDEVALKINRDIATAATPTLHSEADPTIPTPTPAVKVKEEPKDKSSEVLISEKPMDTTDTAAVVASAVPASTSIVKVKEERKDKNSQVLASDKSKPVNTTDVADGRAAASAVAVSTTMPPAPVVRDPRLKRDIKTEKK